MYVVLTQKMRYLSETEEKNSLVIIQEDQMKRNVHFVKIVVKTTYDIWLCQERFLKPH
jgi:hypothetical protein